MLRSLALSLSGRYDDYSDFGSTTNPKVGVNWAPVDGVLVRGSYGTSFRAPGMRQVGATVGAYYLDAATSAVAPTTRRGARRRSTPSTCSAAIDDLQPEEATTYSFGVDCNPTLLPDLRASLTYYNLEYTDVIGTPSVPIVFTDPTFASLVYRNPTPTQLASLLVACGAGQPADVRCRRSATSSICVVNNFGIRETDGLDFDINYRWTTDFGCGVRGPGWQLHPQLRHAVFARRSPCPTA